jgi:hypothetical protein
MTVNVGKIDRILRVVVGIVLLIAPFATSWSFAQSSVGMAVFIIAGIVMIATSAMRFCPMYRIFGIRTCQK